MDDADDAAAAATAASVEWITCGGSRQPVTHAVTIATLQVGTKRAPV